MAALGVTLGSEGSWGVQALWSLLTPGSGIESASEMSHRWAALAFDAYHWDQYNLFALLFPGHLLLIPLIAGRRIPLDRINVHLIAASLGMLVFHFNYRALLGALGDWNLFASAAVPLAALVWRNLLAPHGPPHKAALAVGWAALSSAHTLAWILLNHRYVP
jgi:hypothetical protein